MLNSIQDYPGYWINTRGEVFSTYGNRKFKKLKTTINTWGYEAISIYRKDGERKTHRVHRLVAKAFLLNPMEQVNHKDGNKLNNDVKNLEWCTRSHNIQHGYDTGLYSSKAGEKNGRSVLTKGKVLEIKKLILSGKSNSELSEEFKVSPQVINHIRKGNTWSHVGAL